MMKFLKPGVIFIEIDVSERVLMLTRPPKLIREEYCKERNCIVYAVCTGMCKEAREIYRKYNILGHF